MGLDRIIELAVPRGNQGNQPLLLRLKQAAGVHPVGGLTVEHLASLEIHGGERVLDLGCGSGIFGLFALKAGAAHAVLTDIDPEALEAARENACLNEIGNADFRLGDFFEPVQGEMFDLVIANVPQTPAPTHFRMDKWGGLEGTDHLLRLAREGSDFLMPGGRLYFVHIGLACPDTVNQAFRCHFQLNTVHEERRFFTPEEYDSYQPGLFCYLLELRRQGKAEFVEEGGRWHFLTRFYCAEGA